MNSKLFIAEKVKVGFNPRTDTYSGKLGYVIGHDGKKWRKEPSWEGWRYHYMDADEYEQKKRTQYNDRIASLKRSHADYAKRYNDDPIKNSYYRDYAEMTEEAYVNQYEGTYEDYKPYLGNVSPDEGLMPIEFDNVPTEGFVLNKKVGGYSNGWDHRSTYCRVYDPRGFEFEISVPNLLFILQECNAMKGKGLEGTFVYAWDGKDLVLLPTTSLDYKESQKFTEIQSQKIGVKDLVEGCTYKTKQMEEYIYLGKFNWFEDAYRYSSDKHDKTACDKRYVFYKVEKPRYGNRIEGFTSLSKFATKTNDTPVSNYAELLDEFNNSKNSMVFKETDEIDIHIPRQLDSYYSSYREFGLCYLPLGNDQYEVYNVETDEVEHSNGSYYSNRNNRTIYSYKLTAKKIVIIKDGDFKIKTIKPKLIEKISYQTLKDMNLKLITVNKNNQKRVLIF